MAKNSFDDGQTWVVPRENKTNERQLYFHDKNLSNLIFQRGCGWTQFNFKYSNSAHSRRKMLSRCWLNPDSMLMVIVKRAVLNKSFCKPTKAIQYEIDNQLWFTDNLIYRFEMDCDDDSA